MNARKTLTAIAASGLVLGSAGLANAGRTSIETGVRIGGEGGYVDVNYGKRGKRERVGVHVGVRGDRYVHHRRGHDRPHPGYHGPHHRRGPGYDAPPPYRRGGFGRGEGRGYGGHDHYGHYDLTYEIDRAWRLVAQGKHYKARRSFERLIERRPYDANLKAGYAVASAVGGEFRKASWAMRRAFEQDIDRLHSIPDFPGLRKRLNGVTTRVNRQLRRYGESPDMLFLLAGLEVLRGDEYAAMEAAEQAKYLGDHSRSLRRLLRYVNRH